MAITVIAGMVSFASLVGSAIVLYFLNRQPEDQGANRRPRQVAQWSSRRKLDFFCNASNLLMQLPIYEANQIERNSFYVFERGNWRVHLTPGIENYLFPRARASVYNPTSMKSLLLAIRNNGIRQNYDQLQPDIKREFGNYPAGYLRYWTSKFPNLLMHAYDVMEVYESDPSMRTFYRQR